MMRVHPIHHDLWRNFRFGLHDGDQSHGLCWYRTILSLDGTSGIESMPFKHPLIVVVADVGAVAVGVSVVVVFVFSLFSTV